MNKLNLDKIYKEVLKDCGKDASSSLIEQEFLAEVKSHAKKELEENTESQDQKKEDITITSYITTIGEMEKAWELAEEKEKIMIEKDGKLCIVVSLSKEKAALLQMVEANHNG